MIDSTAAEGLVGRGVRWVRVVAAGAGATLQLGSQAPSFAVVALGGYVAPPGESWDEVRVGGVIRVEWSDADEPYPGPASPVAP